MTTRRLLSSSATSTGAGSTRGSDPGARKGPVSGWRRARPPATLTAVDVAGGADVAAGATDPAGLVGCTVRDCDAPGGLAEVPVQPASSRPERAQAPRVTPTGA